MARVLLISLGLFSLSCRTTELEIGKDGVIGGGDSAIQDTADTGDEDTGEVDTGEVDTGPVDADGDGFQARDDCDDQDSAIHPDADEICDGVDNNCDGVVDTDAVDRGSWYRDWDGDGSGDSAIVVEGCEAPSGYVATSDDCDDRDADFHPGAEEEDCTDPNDYNCDGSVGYADDDGDGYAACEECDDTDRTVNPSATETCDGVDNDCDGDVDEDDAADVLLWYADDDGDGFGDAGVTIEACDAPSGFVADDSDCDDTEALVNPGATELCNGLDDDCDYAVDEDDSADAVTWYIDYDGDGFGSTASTWLACDAPSGFVGNSQDCDDIDALVNPDATEVCNGVDDDCDGDADSDATDRLDWYQDADCDTHGDAATLTASCDAPGADYVETSDDCDDADSLSSPSGTEICDSADNDCDGTVDNDCIDTFLVSGPDHAPVESPSSETACALYGELTGAPDSHNTANLPTYMAMLEGSSSGLVDSEESDSDRLDFSTRCGSSYTAAPGNFSPSTPWPALSATGSAGGGRIRGYINLQCGESLHKTVGLLANDAASLIIGGTELVSVHWNDGQWQKFRYVTFPEPGLYAYEIQWSTNFICGIDPLEVVWSDGFLSGFEDYDEMCDYSSCTYGTGVPIPDFEVLTGENLVHASDGSAPSCAQCSADADCSSSQSCNSAGLCE